jgi:lipooligosaccharide transport system permease protein
MSAPALLRSYERQALVFAKLWRGVAFSTFVVPLLYLGAMGFGLGSLVDDGAGAAELDGLDYLVFVAPGLLCANIMLGAAGESLWPVLGGMKWQGTFNAMVTTPMKPADAFGGYVLWTMTRGAMTATSFVIVGALLDAVVSWWAVLAVPAAMLTALAFATPITAYSGGVETDESFSIIMRLGIIPMFLFSGVFFPLSQLPTALQPLAWLSPLWHGVELARGFTTGDFEPLASLGHAAVLVAVVVAGWVWGVRRFTARLAS